MISEVLKSIAIASLALLVSCKQAERLDDWMRDSSRLHSGDAAALQQWLRANAFDAETFSIGTSERTPGDHAVRVVDRRIHGIKASGVKSLEGLSDLEALERLDLTKSNLADLRGCPSSLVSIRFAWGSLQSLGGIEACPQLATAKLINSGVKDISPLMTLAKLQSLELERHELGAVSFTQELGSLKRLILSQNDITELNGLEHLPQLELLALSENSLSALMGIGDLSKLKTIDLRANKLIDLKRLVVSSSVETLDIRENPVNGLEPLSKWPGLKKIIYRPREAYDLPEGLSAKIDGRFSDQEIQAVKAESLMESYLGSNSFVKTLEGWRSGRALSVSKQTKSHFGMNGTSEISGRITIGELKGMHRLTVASTDNISYQNRSIRVQGTATAARGGLVIISPVDIDFWQQAGVLVDAPTKRSRRDDSLRLRGFVLTKVDAGETKKFSANLQPFGDRYTLLIAALAETASDVELRLHP